MGEERDPETYAIIGAAMEVHPQLGGGFLEAVYQESLGIEFEARGVPARQQVELALVYKGRPLKTFYKADFICFDTVIVELKAPDRLGGVERAQIINYLKATGIKRGLLLDFGAVRLEYEPFVLSSLSLSVPSVSSVDFYCFQAHSSHSSHSLREGISGSRNTWSGVSCRATRTRWMVSFALGKFFCTQ
jgi:GxxExxY protein